MAEAGEVTASQIYADAQVARLADAAVAGDAATVATLAAQGADVNARGDRGVNLLQWVFLHQRPAGFKPLLNAGIDPSLVDDNGNTVLHYAAAAEDPAGLQALLEAGVPPDIKHAATGETALFTAITHDREPQFRALLAAGADLEARDNTQSTPLHQAAKVNDPARVLALLDAGADANAVNAQGVTFQAYLNTMADDMRTADGRRAKAQVDDWLKAHGIPLQTAP